MKARLDYGSIAPEATKLMIKFEQYLHTTALDATLIELVKTRASQINGCAFCLDMHTKDARANGESEQRLYALNAWRETDFYTARERAALALTEAVTEISSNHISDELYETVRKEFNEKDFIDLIFMINTINSWNRLAIVTRAVPGKYEPKGR